MPPNIAYLSVCNLIPPPPPHSTSQQFHNLCWYYSYNSVHCTKLKVTPLVYELGSSTSTSSVTYSFQHSRRIQIIITNSKIMVISTPLKSSRRSPSFRRFLSIFPSCTPVNISACNGAPSILRLVWNPAQNNHSPLISKRISCCWPVWINFNILIELLFFYARARSFHLLF
jgi:hypothetical protein